LEHRIGGLEKQHITGNIDYDPDNHDFMVKMREAKIERIAQDVPEQEIEGPSTGDVLVVGWGSTYGAIRSAVSALREKGKKVSHMHLRYLNPFPRNLAGLFKGFTHILVPEINNGQLIKLLRARYLIDARPFNVIKGLPLREEEIEEQIESLLGERHV
jgi:2-oxoglutarate ferredoxin oxidoreductase subunit alpha